MSADRSTAWDKESHLGNIARFRCPTIGSNSQNAIPNILGGSREFYIPYPLVPGIAAIGFFVATPWLQQIHSEQILRDNFSIFSDHEQATGYLARAEDSDFLDVSGAIPYLVNFDIRVVDLGGLKAALQLDALKNLKGLQTLKLTDSQLRNVDDLGILQPCKLST